MKKIAAFFDTHRKKLWFSLLLNALLLFLLLLFLKPFYEVNDDNTIYELTSGARGLTDYHTIYIHVLIGHVLEVLYRLHPDIVWHTVLQTVILYFSFTSIFYVLQNRLKPSMAFASYGILFFYFSYVGYISMQFSRTAGFAVCAGILLMFYALELQSRKTILPLLAGMILALLGGMYRYKEFLLCAFLMSGLGVYKLVTIEWHRGKTLQRILISYICSFAALFLLFGTLFLYDRQVYRSDPDWASYVEMNTLRSNLLDYGFPSYAENQELYESFGISKADLNMITSFNYADPEVLTPEALRALTAVRKLSSRKFSSSLIKDFFNVFPVSFFTLFVFQAFLMVCFLWLFWGKKGWKEWLLLLYEAFLIGGSYFYLFYIGRYLVSRVESPMWLAASLTVLWILHPDREGFDRKTALAIGCLALAASSSSWYARLRIGLTAEKNAMRAEREFQQNIGSDTGHLYLSKLGVLSVTTAYGPYDAIPSGSLSNICKLGGWEYGMPSNDRVLTSYGITNPYRDMINNDSVIVADSNEKKTLSYLQDNYNKNTKCWQIKDIGSRRFFMYRSDPVCPPALKNAAAGSLQAPDDSVFCDYTLDWEENALKLSGSLYKRGTNSFAEIIYLKTKDLSSGETSWSYAVTSENIGNTDLNNGRYGAFTAQLPLKKDGFSRERFERKETALSLVLQTEDALIEIPVLPETK